MDGLRRCAPPRTIVTAIVVAVSCWALACRSVERAVVKESKIDRLVRAYPELRAGRFVVIADFEEPSHMELVRAEGASAARTALAAKGGRAETGAACLSARFAAPDDAVVFSNTGVKEWSLKRDWHEFDLLLLSVFSPQAGVELALSVRSGAGEASRTAETRQPLSRGWNPLRFDLADLGEHVSLDDVREIWVSASSSKRPVDLRLDDLLLTAGRSTILGKPDEPDGAMFVYRQGRRYHIGTGGKFELVFGNGQLVGWYDLASDPKRVRNLWDGVTLGFALRQDAERASAESAPGIVVSSQLREANAVRSVFAVEMRKVQPPPDESGLVYRWTYSIYPTGKAYTSVEFGPRFSTVFADPPLLQFTKGHPENGELGSVWFSGWPPEGEDLQHGVFSPTGAAANMALIATIPIDETKSSDRGPPRGSGSLNFGPAHPKQFDRTRPWLVRLAHSDHPLRDEDPVTFPGWFEGPATISLVARSGRAVSETVAFDGRTGTYRVDANRAPVRLDSGTEGGWCCSPAFVVTEVPGADAWVYANGKLVIPTARDADGNLIFQLPGVIREKTVVDVLFGRDGPSPPK